MSLRRLEREHDNLITILAVSVVITIGIIGMVMFFEWNDEQYFKTLDKLTCGEIWELMVNGHIDWDTMDYYGDRC